jgi:phosphohistidine phosphatase
MKTLLLMRHAKASQQEPGQPDQDRALAKRGERQAPAMGKLLQEKGLVPQAILSSSALRARQTAQAVAKSAGYTGEIAYYSELYSGELPDYGRILRSLADSLDPVLVVGHNPDMQEWVALLTGQHEDLSTAAIACLTLPIVRWADLRSDTRGELLQVWRSHE